MTQKQEEEMSEEVAVRIDLEGIQNIRSNLLDVKRGLAEMVAPLMSYEVTEDNLADAKQKVADLRKAEKALEDERKRCKAQWLRPYEEWEAMYKDTLQPLRDTITRIASEASSIEKEAEDKRVIGRKGFIETLLNPVNEGFGIELPLERIWEEKWRLKSTSDKAFTAESTAKVQQIMKDLAFLAGKDRAVIMRYAETLSLTDTLEYEKALNAPEPIADAEAAGTIAPSFRFSFQENSPEEKDKEILTVNASFRAERWKVNMLMKVAAELGMKMKVSR